MEGGVGTASLSRISVVGESSGTAAALFETGRRHGEASASLRHLVEDEEGGAASFDFSIGLFTIPTITTGDTSTVAQQQRRAQNEGGATAN